MPNRPIAALFALTLGLSLACGGGGNKETAMIVPVGAAPAEGGFSTIATLTPEQAKAFVDAMNDMCGDTFCEGEDNYVFKEFSCTDKDCKLTFEAEHYDRKKKVESEWVMKDCDQLFGEYGESSDDFLDKTIEASIAWEQQGM